MGTSLNPLGMLAPGDDVATPPGVPGRHGARSRARQMSQWIPIPFRRAGGFSGGPGSSVAMNSMGAWVLLGGGMPLGTTAVGRAWVGLAAAVGASRADSASAA